MNDTPLIARLAAHLQRPVPEAVRTRARLHLLDWLACVAGARGSEIAGVLSSGLQGSALMQSFYLGNILEMDDVHRAALLHPGPIIWPAAFKGTGDGLDDFLDAAVRGYEAMVAIGATFDAYHYAHWHPTATAGIIGAAVTNLTTEQVDAAKLSHAMALAASVSGGFWQTRHSANFGKAWHVAHAVESGGSAADYALAGVTGPLDVLEGPQGLYAATCREPKPMVLGPGWRIEEVSFKPWAACRHAHPAIDCALELRAAGRLTPPFHVETYADALTFCDKPDPTTETEAKFSLQHAVAVIAAGRDATPADFTPEAIAQLAGLRKEVTVTFSEAIDARYPAHFGARVNGFELHDCRGDPERPMSEADIVAKMHMLGDWGGLPPSEADRAADLALHGDDAVAIVAMLEEWLR